VLGRFCVLSSVKAEVEQANQYGMTKDMRLLGINDPLITPGVPLVTVEWPPILEYNSQDITN
jgi:hypothetical protein